MNLFFQDYGGGFEIFEGDLIMGETKCELGFIGKLNSINLKCR